MKVAPPTKGELRRTPHSGRCRKHTNSTYQYSLDGSRKASSSFAYLIPSRFGTLGKCFDAHPPPTNPRCEVFRIVWQMNSLEICHGKSYPLIMHLGVR